MKTRSLLFFVIIALPLAAHAQKSPASIAGTWEGESICTVRDSPCHDEHVVYEIARDPAPIANSTPSQPRLEWRMDAYKIVNGEKQPMGSLHCSFDETKKNLSCLAKTRTEVDWEYFFDGDTLRGTLQIGSEKTLFRTVSAKRVSSK